MSKAVRLLGAGVVAAALIAGRTAMAAEAPRFEVDPFWPKPLPNNWILGQVAGIAVDTQDHVWIIQRPRTLTDDEKGATLNPQRSQCCAPAPPVIEFDRDGNVVQAWGGPGAGYDWPKNEHGIRVDAGGFVWLGGNAPDDGMILKFARDGKFVMQIGKPGPSKGDNDTDPTRPASRYLDRSRRASSMSRTATAITASSCSMRRPVPISGTGAPTASARPTTRDRHRHDRPPMIRRRRRRRPSAIRCIA